MTTTTYYNLNIVEGTDVVNPLTVDNPNYEKIDETMHNNAVAGVTLATEITNATVHAITRENSDCAVIRFIATSQWKAGDTATVDGVPVTALLPSGETLPDGAYVINANVLCILTGTNLTIFAERKKAENANDIAYNETTVGAELVRLDGDIARLDGEVVRLDAKIDNVNVNIYPDYSQRTDIKAYQSYENAFECPSNGYILLSRGAITGGTPVLCYINNTNVLTISKSTNDNIGGAIFPVKKGDLFHSNGFNYTYSNIDFIPNR